VALIPDGDPIAEAVATILSAIVGTAKRDGVAAAMAQWKALEELITAITLLREQLDRRATAIGPAIEHRPATPSARLRPRPPTAGPVSEAEGGAT
jgi:hypothetical protein